MKKMIVIAAIINIFVCYKSYCGTWKRNGTPMVEQLIYTRVEASASAAYSNLLSYPGIGIAYGGISGVYYTYFDTSINNWKINTVETGENIGRDISLKIDSVGRPHISYIDWDKQNLKYAYYNNTSWQISVIDDNPETGRFSCLQIDVNNNPHISYYDARNGALKYAYYNGTVWIKETIDIAPEKMVGLYISFKIDKKGNRHISYYDATDDDLKYAYYNGTNWNIEKVDTTEITGLYTYLTLDNSNIPYITYYSNKKLKIAYKNTTWENQIIDTTFSTGMYWSRVDYNADSTKRVFYYYKEPSETKYAFCAKDSNVWNLETIKSGVIPQDIVCDKNNEIWLFCIRNGQNAGLKSIGPGFSGWPYKVIENSNVEEDRFSLAIDTTGNPNIAYSYRNNNKKELRYTYYNSNWSLYKVIDEESENYPYFLSPTIRYNNNKLYAAYLKRQWTSSEGEIISLKCADYDYANNTWTSEIVKYNISDTYTGKGSLAFVVDKGYKPSIGYFNSNKNIEIKFNTTGNVWESTIFNPDYVANPQSRFDINFDNENKLHIAYSRGGIPFYYSFQKDSTWETPYIVDNWGFLWYIGLKIDNYNKKHILYVYDGGNPKYAASFDGKNWTKENINVGVINGIEMDLKDNGEPVLLFWDLGSLYLCYKKNGIWIKEYIMDVNRDNMKGISFKLYKNIPGFVINQEDGLKYYVKPVISIEDPTINGKKVTLNAKVSTIKGIDIKGYLWNFDGEQGSEWTTEPTKEYTFPDYGTYKVHVTLVSDGGRVSAVKDVFIISQ